MQKSFLLFFFLSLILLYVPSHAGGSHDLSFKVSRGDAFYKFFFSAGLSGDLLTKLMSADKKAQRLNNIFPGDKFRIILNDDHSLKEIVFSPLKYQRIFVEETYTHRITAVRSYTVYTTIRFNHGTTKSEALVTHNILLYELAGPRINLHKKAGSTLRHKCKA